jgi:phosphoglycolate phosphatase
MKDVLLLFDLDGTLWDSAPAVAEAWNEVFRRECPGLKPLTVEDIHGVMGMTMKEISLALYPDTDMPRRDEIFDICCRHEVEYLYTHCGTLYPDFRSVMESLKAEGYDLAVVSNCQEGYVRAFLVSSGASDLFIDYEEWERTGLTKGENIRLVMERNGYAKGIYIGDTKKDREAALLAGIPFIHAAYGFGEVESADGIISSLKDLPGEISRMPG